MSWSLACQGKLHFPILLIEISFSLGNRYRAGTRKLLLKHMLPQFLMLLFCLLMHIKETSQSSAIYHNRLGSLSALGIEELAASKACGFHCFFLLMQGQDGVDLEMNLNGSRSGIDDDNLDYMVCSFLTLPCLLFLLLDLPVSSGNVIQVIMQGQIWLKCLSFYPSFGINFFARV